MIFCSCIDAKAWKCINDPIKPGEEITIVEAGRGSYVIYRRGHEKYPDSTFHFATYEGDDERARSLLSAARSWNQKK